MTKKTQSAFRRLRRKLTHSTTPQAIPMQIKSINALRKDAMALIISDAGLTLRDVEVRLTPLIAFKINRSDIRKVIKECLAQYNQ